MAESQPSRCSLHVVGVLDVAGHDVHAHRHKRIDVRPVASERPDAVATLDQELADVGARKSGCAGDEHVLVTHACASFVATGSVSTGNAVST